MARRRIQEFREDLFYQIKENSYYKTKERDPDSLLFGNMRLFRNILFYSAYCAFTLAIGFSALLRRWHEKKTFIQSCRFLFFCEQYGLQFEFSGFEHIKEDQFPIIFIANHMGIMETQLLAGILHPLTPVSFVVKKELMWIPLFGSLMRRMRAIPTSRENTSKEISHLVEEVKGRASEQRSIIIFPEGTRMRHFDREKFNSIGISLAKICNLTPQPVALKTDGWEMGKRVKGLGWLRPEKINRIEFGPPLTSKKKGDQHRETLDFIETRLEQWRGTDDS